MDVKERKINAWLDTMIDRDSNNMTFCDDYISDIFKIIQSKQYKIKDLKQLRDDIIEIIYNYSHE